MKLPTELKILLTPHELDIVTAALAEQPYRIVQGVIHKILVQANNQQTVASGDPLPTIDEDAAAASDATAHHPV